MYLRSIVEDCLPQGQEVVVGEVQVDEAAQVAEAGGGDQPKLIVGQVDDLEDGGQRLEEAGLDVGDVVEGEVQGPAEGECWGQR